MSFPVLGVSHFLFSNLEAKLKQEYGAFSFLCVVILNFMFCSK